MESSFLDFCCKLFCSLQIWLHHGKPSNVHFPHTYRDDWGGEFGGKLVADRLGEGWGRN